MTGETKTKTQCPQCEEDFDNVTLHWNVSSTCNYPPPTDRQEEILEGVLLTRGMVANNPKGDYPYIKIRSVEKQLLDWLHDELRPFSNPVRVELTAEESSKQFEHLQNNLDLNSPNDVQDIYSVQTCNHPDLARFEKRWTGDEGRAVPPDVTPTPLKLKAVYAFTGSFQPEGHNGRDIAHISLGRTRPPLDALDSLFGKFGPSTPADDTRKVILRNCSDFYEYIGDSLPGSEFRWPEDGYEFDEPEEICPGCNGRFGNMAAHRGADNPLCSH